MNDSAIIDIANFFFFSSSFFFQPHYHELALLEISWKIQVIKMKCQVDCESIFTSAFCIKSRSQTSFFHRFLSVQKVLESIARRFFSIFTCNRRLSLWISNKL